MKSAMIVAAVVAAVTCTLAPAQARGNGLSDVHVRQAALPYFKRVNADIAAYTECLSTASACLRRTSGRLSQDAAAAYGAMTGLRGFATSARVKSGLGYARSAFRLIWQGSFKIFANNGYTSGAGNGPAELTHGQRLMIPALNLIFR